MKRSSTIWVLAVLLAGFLVMGILGCSAGSGIVSGELSGSSESPDAAAEGSAVSQQATDGSQARGASAQDVGASVGQSGSEASASADAPAGAPEQEASESGAASTQMAADMGSASSDSARDEARRESDARESAQQAAGQGQAGAIGQNVTFNASGQPVASGASEQQLKAELALYEDYRPSLAHGYKGPEYQKYIVLHDTEGSGSPQSVVDWWDGNGNLIAAHFVVGKDGTVVQCVPLDEIGHHAGFGDAGHNDLYGVQDESRDDKLGTTPIGPSYPDYGMNSHSIGIELVHIGGEGYYPEEQLQALDKLIAYIDAHYGGPGRGGTIIDHKMWRTSNGDTSPEFSDYLANYRDHRTHDHA